ncbi:MULTISPECIES: peptidoglycan D,D-transpeptidase FtsI family protein [Gordonibacter]|uniref:Penicillin-binding protein 2 n=1 Tax=Gordonibacter faecis TaxID=3047475 RepID=A0ABT7DNR4_9ACTN|nr:MULTISPECIES: penicillin-binding protein 2 [unclassified Gordonibacter]MDJ1650867.1 penicillin-binding protein 2 [Gordonibacter sp. KGMB12511]HIW76123.1 penicillin-binding protein 2 [Candidatus Gordonibacter avicola]
MAGKSHTSRAARGGQGRAFAGSSRASSFVEAAESSRAFFPIVVFGVIALLLLARLVYLQVIVAPEYSAQAQEARTVGFGIEPRRGTIYDRNGTVLAVSVDATTIYANPSEVEDIRGTAKALAGVLGGEMADYEDILAANTSTFAFVKRKADVEVAQKVKELKLKGIYFIADTRREYPNGQIAGQIVGSCEIALDKEAGREYYKGLTGLEKYYDDILSGEPGYYEAERGRDGQPIPGGVHESTPAVDGQDIIISIDLELQQFVEERLTSGVKDLSATGGNAVVMDGATGEIYAAASLPLFNPADRSKVETGATELKSVSDLFEPGSIFKSVTAMAVLETETMTPDTELFCPATLEADGYVISDAHDRGDATFTLRQIMDQSSNIGISLAAQNMGFDKLYDYILKYNLHEKTGVDFPGEGVEGSDVVGYMVPFDELSRVGAYNVSFGQGISVTPLQMTRFYGALTNNGVECTPHFLISKPQTGEKICYPTEDVVENKAAIPQMTDMLKTVVTEGTGKKAAIEGFNVAGKTSTAEIYEQGKGYREGVYNLAFTGFLADSSSQLVCFVGANEVPSDGVVTPLFKDIMATAIDRFQILPE